MSKNQPKAATGTKATVDKASPEANNTEVAAEGKATLIGLDKASSTGTTSVETRPATEKELQEASDANAERSDKTNETEREAGNTDDQAGGNFTGELKTEATDEQIGSTSLMALIIQKQQMNKHLHLRRDVATSFIEALLQNPQIYQWLGGSPLDAGLVNHDGKMISKGAKLAELGFTLAGDYIDRMREIDTREQKKMLAEDLAMSDDTAEA